MRRFIASFCLIFFCLAASPLLAAEGTVERSEGTLYRIHLGTGVGDTAVSRDLLKAFIDQQITPLFPEGLTITDARGQWKSEEYGVIRERAVLIDILCPDTQASDDTIAGIARVYVERFKGAKASVYVMKITGVRATLYY